MLRAKSLQSCPTFCDTMMEALWALCSWDSPGKNTGMCCNALLQGVCLT